MEHSETKAQLNTDTPATARSQAVTEVPATAESPDVSDSSAASGSPAKQRLFSRTWVKVLSSVLLFAVFICGITFAMVFPFDRIFSADNQFNYIFLGASETEWGIAPYLFDSKMNSRSCLLATSGATYNARYEMLEPLIGLDSLKMVVFELSESSLHKNMSNYPLDRRVLYFSRISGLDNKLKTAFHSFSFWEDEYDQLYGEMLFEGLKTWRVILKGIYPLVFAQHGYSAQWPASQLLTAEEAAELYNSDWVDTRFREENLNRLKDIADLCRAHDVPVIFITMPLSEYYVWYCDGWDEFHDCITEFTEENNIPYFDFNLWTDRQSVLSDDVSYRDEEHLCDDGSIAFTQVLADLVADYQDDGEVTSFRFYDSYAQAKEHSTYHRMLYGQE